MTLDTSDWNPPSPRELPALCARLADQMINPYERASQVEMLRMGRGSIRPEADPATGADVLLQDERQRLQAASLYFVSGEMTHVAQQAGAKLPTWEVRPEDVPTEAGFMIFEEPYAEYIATSPYLSDSATVAIVGASWGPTMLRDYTDQVLWLTFWSVTHEADIVGKYRELGFSQAKARQLYRETKAELSWDNEALLTYGSPRIRQASSPERIDPADGSRVLPTTAPWVQTVRATWLLMKQDTTRPIADVEDQPLPRTIRRTAQRQGLSASSVRVVNLHRRHRPRASTEHASGYTVKVRSHVTGHVRWQPYRSRNTIEPIWIEPHVRGPEGAPFSQKPQTVNVLDRPPGGRPPGGGR